MARLGVSATEFKKSGLDATLDAVVDHGIGSVQFHFASALPDIDWLQGLLQGLHLVGPHITDDLCRQIRDGFDSRGLEMAAIDGTFNAVHPDPAVRADGLTQFAKVAESCHILGTKVIAGCPGSRDLTMWNPHPDNRSPETWKQLVETMTEVARIAEANDVVVGIEPEVVSVVTGPHSARRLMDEVESPSIKVLLDPANMFNVGDLERMTDRIDEAFDLVGNDIVLAHAKDLDKDGEDGHLAAGTGKLDYRHFLDRLQRSGYDGTIVLHQIHYLTDADMDKSFEYVRSQAPSGFVN
jgi:sugar phosphate isomerase/epimerase